jgi:hypothetical protein
VTGGDQSAESASTPPAVLADINAAAARALWLEDHLADVSEAPRGGGGGRVFVCTSVWVCVGGGVCTQLRSHVACE